MTFMMTSSNDDKFFFIKFFQVIDFFIETCSILSIQYMHKISCKTDKYFLRYSICFHRGPNRPPSQPWDFQKSPAQLGLRLLAARKTNDFESIKVCTVKGPWIVLHCEKRITIQFKNKASSRSLHCVINLQKPNSFTKCHPDILNSSDAKVINCLVSIWWQLWRLMSWDVA